MNQAVFASQAGRSEQDVVMFRVGESFLVQAADEEWSQPVQFRFHALDDGTFELLIRSVELPGMPFDV